MAVFKDINSSVRIGGSLVLPAGSITLSNKITLDEATGKVTATSFAGNGSLITNLSSAAMTDVLLLNGTRSMTGNLTLGLNGANGYSHHLVLKDSGHYIRHQMTGIDAATIDGIRVAGYQGVELIRSSDSRELATFRGTAAKINAPLTVTTSVTSTTINATGNLQENGTNLSTKYEAKGTLHDDRYYTESEMDTKLGTKSDVGHTHTFASLTSKPTTLAGFGITDASLSTHLHDDRYYTETEVDDLLATKSDSTHLHDDRYYTETEMNTFLSGKSDTSHTHAFGDLTAKPTTLTGYGITDAATSTHNHDSVYLKLAGGQTIAGALTVSGAAIVGGSSFESKGFDLRLGTGDQVSRGDSGASRAMVKNTGNVLAINYAGDFTGGVHVQGTSLTSNGKIVAPTYWVGTTEVVDASGKVDWARIKNAPATYTPSTHTHAFADLTSKPTTVSGYGITDAIKTSGNQTIGGNLTVDYSYADRFYQRWNGVPVNNLGNPTITEMALFDQQFNNKTWFYDPAKITFEYTMDGTTWLDPGYSTNTIKDFVSGNNNSGVSIPNGALEYRITVENDGNYVFLNALYMYWSSNSHSTKVKIQTKSYDPAITTWTQHTNSETSVSSWPGHLHLPFNSIAFSRSYSQIGYVRIIFIPTWSGHATYGTSPINLNGMEIWGGYPSGRRLIYTHDRDKNVTFPAQLRSTGDMVVNGNTVWHAGNLAKSEFATAGHLHDDRYYTETEMDTKLSGKSDTGHTHTFASLTSKPTTLSGFGITDAATADHTHPNATSSAHGLMSSTDKTKFDTMSALKFGSLTGGGGYVHFNSGVTNNDPAWIGVRQVDSNSTRLYLNVGDDSTDADYVAITTHTGEGTAVDADLSNISERIKLLGSGIVDAVAGFKVNGTEVIDSAGKMDWSKLKNTPATFPATAHTHAIADVSGLQSTLDGKSDDGHIHAIADVTGLQTALDGKSDDGHIHAIADTTGLQTALDGKSDDGHTHLWEDITDKPVTFPATAHNHDDRYYTETEMNTFLGGKSDTGHTHLWADITDKPTTFTATAHTHGIADVTGLQTALDGKLASGANAVSASKLATARTISLGGDASGSVSFDGSANVTITATVADDSHDHTKLKYIDDRDVKPVDTTKARLAAYFTSLEGLTGVNGSDYQDLLVLNMYTDASGGSVNALSFDKSTQTIRHYLAAQDATTWGTAKTIAYTDSSITGNAATASKWQTARTITLAGDLSGSVSIDGSANVTLTATVLDDSHAHIIADVDGLQSALDGKSATSHNHDSVYVNVTGDTMTGNLNFSETGEGITWNMNTDGAAIYLKNASDADADSALIFETRDNGNEYFKFQAFTGATATELFTIKSDALRFKGSTVWHTSNFDPATKADKSTTISVGTGLTGGGDLSANRTIGVNFGTAAGTVAEGNHLHDDRYYTETEMNTFLAGKSDDGHTHLWADITDKPSTFAPSAHNHDDMYYTETEVDTLLSDKSDVGHTHAFADLTAKPTTLAGYGITDASASGHTHAFSSLTSKPTTLSGYGITDAATSTHNHDSTYLKLAGGTVTGSISSTNGSTFIVANPSEALDNVKLDWLGNKPRIRVGGGGATSNATFEIQGVGDTVRMSLDSSGNGIFTGTVQGTAFKVGSTTVVDTNGKVDWSALKSVPSTFAPSAHTHAISDITNLQTTLNGKSDTSHTHTFASLTSKPTTLSGYGITDAAPSTIANAGGLPSFMTTGFTPLPIFGDELRFRKPKSIEYFDGTNWVAWAGANFDNLTDGRGNTQGSNIDYTHRNFRVTYDIETWTEGQFVYVCGSYNTPGGTLAVETTKDNWVTTNVRLADTSCLGSYWRYAKMGSAADDNQIRFIFNFTGATAQSANWWLTEIQWITPRPGEQGSGWETWFPFSWDINKHMTTTGEMKAATFRKSDGTQVSYEGHTHDDRYYTESEIDTKLSGKSNTGHTHAWTEITSKPTTFTPSTHTHLWADITDKPTTFTPATHSHSWSEILSKPTEFTPSAHTHAIADVTGLQTALDGKAASSHTHAIADVTGLQTALDGKSDDGHGHAISDITNLQTTLNGKAASSHTHAISEVTGLQTALDGKSDDAHNHDSTYLKLSGGILTGMLTLKGQGDSGSNAYGMVSDTALNIEHATAGGSSTIYFKSTQNYPSDFAYIRYQDTTGAAGTELGQLTIGVENDGSGGSDKIMLKGYTVINSDSFSTDHTSIVDFQSAGVSKGNISNAGHLTLSGNIVMAANATVDGVDISAFKSTYDSHNHDTAYLGISAKATDSDKLDGLNSTQFLRSDQDATLSGSLTAGVVYTTGGVHLKAGPTSDHVYMSFFADSQSLSTRSAWIGYGSAGATGLSITNEMTNGSIYLTPSGTGKAYVGNNEIYTTANLPAYVGTGNNQSIGTGFTVNGTMYVGSTSAGTNNGDLIIRGGGQSTIHLDGDSSGSVNSTVKSYISGTGNATFAGTVTANSIAVTSGTMVNNLNAERLEGKRAWDFDTPATNNDLGGYGVISGMQPRQGGATGPDATVKIEPGVVYTSSGRRHEFTTTYSATVNQAYQQYDRWDIFYVRGPVDTNGNPDPANEGVIQYAKGATDGLEPAIPTGSVPLVKIRVAMNDTGGVTVKDGSTGETPNLYDIRAWKPFRYDGSTFTMNDALNVSGDITEKGTTLEDKYARLGTANVFTGNMRISTNSAKLTIESTNGNSSDSNPATLYLKEDVQYDHGLKVEYMGQTNYGAISTVETGVKSERIKFYRDQDLVEIKTDLTVTGHIKAAANAKTLTISAGQTSVTWTHNYGATTYAVNPVANSFDRHVRWTNKTANAITIEIDSATTEDILVDCILIGY